jgi:hypothetical protein
MSNHPMLEGPGGGIYYAKCDADGRQLVSLDMPRTHTAIVPDDDDDITAVANWALLASGEGTLAYRTVGAPDVTVRIAIDGYTPIPGQFCRVMAETDDGVSVIGVSQ